MRSIYRAATLVLGSTASIRTRTAFISYVVFVNKHKAGHRHLKMTFRESHLLSRSSISEHSTVGMTLSILTETTPASFRFMPNY